MADKNIDYGIPPNYVSIAMLKETWIKEQERKKKGKGEQQDKLQQTNPEHETLAPTEQSIVVETVGTEKDTEIQAPKKKKGKKKNKREKKKREGDAEEVLAGSEPRAPVISEGKNGPAGTPSEIRPKREIVAKQSDRGGEDVKRNHAEKEKGSCVKYVKKVIPSEIMPKREAVAEGSDRVDDVAQKVGGLKKKVIPSHNKRNIEFLPKRSDRVEDIAQKARDLKEKVVPSQNIPNREIVPERSNPVEDIAQKFGDLKKKVIPSEIMPNKEIVPELSDRVEDIAQKVGDLSVNDHRKRRLTRPTGEHKGSRGHQKKTNVQTIWVRKGGTAGGGGVNGKGAK